MIDEGRLSTAIPPWQRDGQTVGVCFDCPRVIVRGERHEREPNAYPRYDSLGRKR